MNSDKWFPVLSRFSKESIQLSPWRMGILLFGKLIASLSPTLQLWINSRLLIIVEQTIKTGRVDKMRLAAYAAFAAFFSTATSSLSGFL